MDALKICAYMLPLFDKQPDSIVSVKISVLIRVYLIYRLFVLHILDKMGLATDLTPLLFVACTVLLADSRPITLLRARISVTPSIILELVADMLIFECNKFTYMSSFRHGKISEIVQADWETIPSIILAASYGKVSKEPTYMLIPLSLASSVSHNRASWTWNIYDRGSQSGVS